MLGLVTTMALVGGLMKLLTPFKKIGAVIAIIGGSGQILWAINDMYNFFRKEEP